MNDHDAPHEHHHHDHLLSDLLTDPHARLSASLVLSLVLWAPFGMAALRSDLDVVAAGIRYLVAFLGCRLAVGGITHLVASYRAMQPAEAPEVALAPAAGAGPNLRRRRDDPPA